MKYLDTGALDKIESESEQDALWKERLEEYKKAYKKLKNRLPGEFCEEYEKCYFHDYEISSIAFEERKDASYNIALTIQSREKTMTIRYCHVISMEAAFNTQDCITHARDILVNELLDDGKGHMRHEFLLSGEPTQGKLKFVFKSLQITSADTENRPFPHMRGYPAGK